MPEVVDTRVLGAIRFVDATTGLWIREPLVVDGGPATLLRNRSGCLVITGAPGLEDHAGAFTAPPNTPALGSVQVTISASDPEGRYLPRRSTIALPRDPDPAHAARADSLFQPADVVLYPAPSAPVGVGWALVRASVVDQAGKGLGGALLRLSRVDGTIIARGLTDARGQAVVAVTGIPVTTWGADSGPVVATEIDATLQALFDPAAGTPPDPDAIERRVGALPEASAQLALVSGGQQFISLVVNVAGG